MSAKVIQAIETDLEVRGDGENIPIRRIRQYWDFDGNLLAEVDPLPLAEKAENESQEKFFLVWTPTTGKTEKRHSSFKEAADEARRLSAKHMERTFYVLMALRSFSNEEEHPF